MRHRLLDNLVVFVDKNNWQSGGSVCDVIGSNNMAERYSSLKIVTVEDHNVNGGLGSYICHVACENMPARVTRIGLRSFAESGPAAELADHYGFSPDKIASTVRAFRR